MVEEQVDVFFCANDSLFLSVAEFLVCAWRFFRVIAELFDDLTDARVFAATDISHRPDTDFTGAISTKDGAILHEGHFAAHACGGNRCPHPCITAADDDQIVRAARCRFFVEAK